jgi:tRNA dimethylallyltransferase
MTEQWALGRDPLRGFRILRMGLDPARGELYQRINRRVREMFDRGLIDETRDLLSKYGESGRPLTAIGYKQVVGLLNGELDRESAIAMVQQAHRNYAKRQMTWFRREPDLHWFPGFGDQPEIQVQARGLIEQNL